MSNAKLSYHINEISQCDEHSLFRVIDKLCHGNQVPKLPQHKDLADKFADFFDDKIRTLGDRIDATQLPPLSVELAEVCQSTFTDFDISTPVDVLKLIKQTSKTSCELDPLPSSVFTGCIDELVPTLTKIINQSLSSGYFPAHFKEASVRPLLKKPHLDAEVFSNYRPISRLSFVSKLIERAVVSQIQNYLNENNLYSSAQSAYRAFHSTETALVRVQKDILCALDKKQETILVLLDFSCTTIILTVWDKWNCFAVVHILFDWSFSVCFN